MGAELGVTCSIFPSDEVTKQFLIAQGRGGDWYKQAADDGANYDLITKKLHTEKDATTIAHIRKYCQNVKVSPASDGYVSVSFARIVIDLNELEPLAAAPQGPDNIVRVADVAGKPVSQVLIGS